MTVAERNVTAGRAAFYNDNRLKIGFFGANCSSGRYVTEVPERWPGTWDDNLELAQAADAAGIDFLLPIGRWKGYGGSTDYQGASYETITWATALLAATKRITVFGTVHAPLFHPLIAAKQMVTADHVSHGRFGLNVVCGWNEGEFEMFGVEAKDHAGRYEQGQEWLDAVKLAWTRDNADFAGKYFSMKGVRENPKPYGAGRPLIMNAGASPQGRGFALRNCDALFTSVRKGTLEEASLEEAAAEVHSAKEEARAMGREINVYTVGVVVCRPTRADAEAYHRYVTEEHADWDAVNNMIMMRGGAKAPPDEFARLKKQFANGNSGLPFIGSPDDVANGLAAVSRAGFSGIALSFVNYLDEFSYFRDEVIPRLERLGVRTPVAPSERSSA